MDVVTASEEERLRRLAASWRLSSNVWSTHIAISSKKAFRECADELAALLDDMDF